ncbi:MAG TPA: crossover junction endodeoxyribonuclease RuvC [Candidatus Limnocylindria bacterium]|nr:crossover junction endodeoxyribonuclease RuvC [Candidatus Limnocylindria bacterium]
MLVMGIDPGLATMGWGVVRSGRDKPGFVACGVITTPPDMPLPQRLVRIDEGVESLLAMFAPDEIAFEQLFFAKNVTTALTVGAARGVAVARCAKSSARLFEYTPMQIKQAVVGYGSADKQQVQKMVKLLLNMADFPRPDDAADAVAAALAHCNTGRFAGLHAMK